MDSIWSAMKSPEGIRVVEILLIVVVLLFVFSISGMPLVLLSTFSPSSSQWDSGRNVFEQYVVEGSSEVV